MHIIEQAIIPKNPRQKCEDGLVVTPHFIAVIDGSTSKSTIRHSLFRTNGRYCMQLVARYIKKAPKTISCQQFCQEVTSYVRRHYRTSLLPLLTRQPEERMAASASQTRSLDHRRLPVHHRRATLRQPKTLRTTACTTTRRHHT